MYPKLVNLSCEKNKLTTLPMYPELELLICSNNNRLITLPIYPKLITLYVDDTHMTIIKLMYPNLFSLPIYPKCRIRRRNYKQNFY